MKNGNGIRVFRLKNFGQFTVGEKDLLISIGKSLGVQINNRGEFSSLHTESLIRDFPSFANNHWSTDKDIKIEKIPTNK
ncbi:hypothetical protein ACFLZ9_00280 [Patescibacteria group bacterium]